MNLDLIGKVYDKYHYNMLCCEFENFPFVIAYDKWGGWIKWKRAIKKLIDYKAYIKLGVFWLDLCEKHSKISYKRIIEYLNNILKRIRQKLDYEKYLLVFYDENALETKMFTF